MQDDELQHLFHQARHAQSHEDWSRVSYGFESRLAGHLDELRNSGPGLMQLWWRAAAACAAVTGMLAVWFILVHAPRAAEDDLTAFWDSGQALFESQLLY